MSCSPFDLRDYFFGELPEEGRRQVELHTKSCAACREELNSLRSTQPSSSACPMKRFRSASALCRTAVYEPSRLLRWWRAFWGSAPRMGFGIGSHAVGGHPRVSHASARPGGARRARYSGRSPGSKPISRGA